MVAERRYAGGCLNSRLLSAIIHFFDFRLIEGGAEEAVIHSGSPSIGRWVGATARAFLKKWVSAVANCLPAGYLRSRFKMGWVLEVAPSGYDWCCYVGAWARANLTPHGKLWKLTPPLP